MMQIHDVVQNSDEWFEARCGIITASCMSKVMAKGKKQEDGDSDSKGRTDYMNELIAERYTGVPAEFYNPDRKFKSKHMENGHVHEEVAKEMYETTRGIKLIKAGFVTNSIGGFTVGCSPDGLVGDDGGIECKGSLQKIHVAIMRRSDVPTQHRKQMQANMFVTGRKWWDFVNHADEFQLIIRRLEPDLELHQEMREAVVKFYEEMEEVAKSIGLEAGTYRKSMEPVPEKFTEQPEFGY